LSASAFLAVGIGAALGAWARWGLAAAMNATFPMIPLGTLTANVVGGFLIGIAMEYFGRYGVLSEEVRLFAVTGFLGALTTFSTFSAEVIGLVSRAHYGWACALVVLHLAGSLAATVLGVICVRSLGS